MPDEIRRQMDAARLSAERQISLALTTRGIMPLPRLTRQRDAFGAGTSIETVDTFGTGYDGTDTVSVFILDYSTLDGPDILAEER